MSRFIVEYRIKGYSLADAFRPDPKFGKRRFIVDSDKLGTDDESAIEVAARQTAPEGYLFHHMEKVGGIAPATNGTATPTDAGGQQ